MQPTQQDLAESYRQLADTEIADLNAQKNSLSEDARVALSGEVERRGLKSAQLSKLHSHELHREAQFDKLQRLHEKRVASYLFFRNDPWRAVALIVAVGLLLIAFIADFISHHGWK